ncbi:MAG: hypothetical protein LBE34_15085 [Flavobacteriaceae bacterium]|jgi:hypothetical protein|nr:hypothetical protein [Flavobacteriaceae bacterium]
MKTLLSLLIIVMCYSCQTTETIVTSPYKLNENKTTVYSAKTFMFKNYYFTYKDGEATLVYQQDPILNGDMDPVYLPLKKQEGESRYQEFTDSSQQISVKIINENEVRLKINKTRHTLYTENYLKAVDASRNNVIANNIW